MGDAFIANHHLRDSRGITKINECHAAVVAASIDPSGQGDGLADKVKAKRSNIVSAKHCFSFRWYHPRDERRHGHNTPIAPPLLDQRVDTLSSFVCFHSVIIGRINNRVTPSADTGQGLKRNVQG